MTICAEGTRCSECGAESCRTLDEANDLISEIQRFHDIAGIKHHHDDVFKPEIMKLRKDLIEEETAEVAEGFGWVAQPWLPLQPYGWKVDLVAIADGCVDTAWVALGCLLKLFGEACTRDLIDEVNQANAAKFPDGKVIRREDGKILKPEGWTPPDIAGVLRKYGFLP